ncbi:hypothetical protein HT031_006592 [Scenedesmus sp. PABB004]|nr:hypothetical protein HT031_006592 [Scenedesmus sp. PABB004]
MDRRRGHSPLPPPREPKAGSRASPPPYGRDAPGERGRGPPLPARRRRSPSPPRGRSPPSYSKRHRRDDDYYERHDRYGSPPPRRGHSPPDYHRRGYDAPPYGDYHHPPPPPRGRERSPERGGEPRSFKRFLMDVPDSVSPAEAQALYEAYLTAHFGDQLRAKFEQDKNVSSVRAMYHPAAFESSLARHKEEAAAAAAALAGDIRSGALDPAAPDFNQGAPPRDDGDDGGAAPAAREGPVCLWKPERVAADYKTARRLVALLDSQRGLRLADNPLLPAPPAAAAGEGEGEAEAEKDGGEGGDGKADAALAAVLAEVEGEEVSCEGEDALAERLAALDLLLVWLWRVHGVDYYGGRELLQEADYMDRGAAARTLRGARPEEGEEQDEAEAKADLADLAERVDKVWAARLEGPDPLLAGCQREEIEKRLDEYVESQIKMESDKKWGSTFSNKYFLEKRFVVKHVYNKHGGRLDEQRDVIRDDLFWRAYEADNRARHAAARAAAQARDAARAGDVAMADAEWQEGYEGGGRGPGRMGPMRGRGGRMAGRGPLLGGLPVLDPGMMLGGLPGPIIMPGPGMPLPMMGPGGLPGPIVLGPDMMLPGDMGGMPLFIPGPGRGLRGGLRGGPRGRGRGGPPGGRGYYDLDAPANNRAVLDYGDL